MHFFTKPCDLGCKLKMVLLGAILALFVVLWLKEHNCDDEVEDIEITNESRWSKDVIENLGSFS